MRSTGENIVTTVIIRQGVYILSRLHPKRITQSTVDCVPCVWRGVLMYFRVCVRAEIDVPGGAWSKVAPDEYNNIIYYLAIRDV